jgi:hypothetical protein
VLNLMLSLILDLVRNLILDLARELMPNSVRDSTILLVPSIPRPTRYGACVHVVSTLILL